MSEYQVKFHHALQQSRWLAATNLPVKTMAEVCNCAERTIRDWKREKFLMDYEALLALCRYTRSPKPKVKKVPRYRHLSEAGRKGGEVVYAKYGRVPTDSARRLSAWRKWWKAEGQYKQNTILVRKVVKRPRRSVFLAEFVGVMLGDGGISGRQLTVTLHAIDDREYGKYISSLITKLFDVPASVRRKRASVANDYVVSRTDLVDFCVEELGLVRGHKIEKGADVPDWIRRDRRFVIACLRGLIDTDGSLFIHEYRSKNRRYRYKKLNFCSRSPLLLRSVYDMMISLGLHPHVRGSMVCLDSQADVVLYMKLVGSKNVKHLKRYLK
jgi:hypothetical protein